jgi:hypothetical protein
MTRPINEIAAEIRKDWKSVSYTARPYLDAMDSLKSPRDSFFLDSASSVVAYFLSNAQSWRGDTARRVKKELKDMFNF